MCPTKTPDIDRQPIAHVEWVDPATLRANSYNPNRVFGPEMRLLKLSILSHGWTQPIVARTDGEIVDGFHRWTLASSDEDIRAITSGLCPVVYLDEISLEEQMLATIRHNRARGQHGVLRMGEIVRALIDSGMDAAMVGSLLQMEDEEVERLADLTPSPQHAGKDHFGKGWVPTRG
ncbi:MAG: ParB N-terminal domain-containing protein [Planctomycetes bacterium]|nr:ParB N-terminal domain-containing protein [Planctomycetota bacterium]MBI3835144.1 ParB N-terminal domain-containing protein [Planctomycetota bacterium]